MGTRQYGKIAVETSREDKVLFPERGLTKGDLIDYYDRIADFMLPLLHDRPLTIKRFPDGIGEGGFYQKNTPDYFPGWIDTIRVKTRDGHNKLVMANRKAALVYLANQAGITLHQWLSRKGSLDKPDMMVFDLDPGSASFGNVRQAARILCDVLGELGLNPFAQVTGSTGIHIIVPLKAREGFDMVRDFAQAIAEDLARAHDSLLTTEQRTEKRGKRIFLDTARNARGQTMAAPYTVRGRPDAPIATPIRIDELSNAKLKPDKYTIGNIFRRLGAIDDPWAKMPRAARSLKKAAERFKRGEHTG